MYIFEFIKSFCYEKDISYVDIDGATVIELSSLTCSLPSFRNYYHLLISNSSLSSSTRLFFTMLHFSANQLAILKVRSPSLKNYAYLGKTSSPQHAMTGLDMRLINIVENPLGDVWEENWLTLSADVRDQSLSMLPKLRNAEPDFQLIFLVKDSQVSEIKSLCTGLALSRHYLLSMDKIGAPSEYLFVAATERLCLN